MSMQHYPIMGTDVTNISIPAKSKKQNTTLNLLVRYFCQSCQHVESYETGYISSGTACSIPLTAMLRTYLAARSMTRYKKRSIIQLSDLESWANTGAEETIFWLVMSTWANTYFNGFVHAVLSRRDFSSRFPKYSQSRTNWDALTGFFRTLSYGELLGLLPLALHFSPCLVSFSQSPSG